MPLERSTISRHSHKELNARSWRISPRRPAALHFFLKASRTSIASTSRCSARFERSTRSVISPPTRRRTECGASSKSRLHAQIARTFVFVLERGTTLRRQGDGLPVVTASRSDLRRAHGLCHTEATLLEL